MIFPGHGLSGKATRIDSGGNDRIIAIERRAKEDLPEPKSDARNIVAEGTADRTAASAPLAHPVMTEYPATDTARATL